jgi:phosphoglycerate dehydrogenase-like enzyme
MKIFITASLEKDGLKRLEKFGTVDYQPMAETKKLLGGSGLVAALDGVDVFITEADNLKRPQIEKLTTLKVICSCRGNPVNIDVEAATEKGIPVLRVPGRNAEGVAELTVALMLMLGRNIPKAAPILQRKDTSQDMTLMAKIFFEYKGHEIWHKKIGLVGFGNIGRTVTALLKPFGCSFIAYDPFVDASTMEKLGVTKVELNDLFKQADIVSIHVMPAPENKGIIGNEQMALMKPTAYFVNTARAWVTDEMAIFEALRDHKIAGAAFDVYEKEPLAVDHPFLTLDNVILLPHIGGNTFEVEEHQTEILIPELEKLLSGEKPEIIVNPKVLDTFKPPK